MIEDDDVFVVELDLVYTCSATGDLFELVSCERKVHICHQFDQFVLLQ